jgi:hypothetical protein
MIWGISKQRYDRNIDWIFLNLNHINSKINRILENMADQAHLDALSAAVAAAVAKISAENDQIKTLVTQLAAAQAIDDTAAVQAATDALVQAVNPPAAPSA